MRKFAIAAAALAMLATPAAAQYVSGPYAQSMYPMASPTARAPLGYSAQGPAYAYAGQPGWNTYAAQPGWRMASPYGYYVTDLREQCISDTCQPIQQFP